MTASTESPKAEPNARSRRMIEIDSLRGIAALMVVFFHYTTRYDQHYGHIGAPLFEVPWGALGVKLFFIISGFVIFMTLERTRHPLDFIISRFSRLYPAYWVAVLLTFCLMYLLGLPGKHIEPATLVANLSMIHGLFGFEFVDGVYWTLEVELIFYTLMLGLWLTGLLKHPYLVISGWLVLRLLTVMLSKVVNLHIPFFVGYFLLLDYIAYFAIGMSIYLTINKPQATHWKVYLLILLALSTVMANDSLQLALISLLFTTAVYAAAHGHWRWLKFRVLVWLGAISYPLYLLHENIGWSILIRLQDLGWNTNISILFAIVAALSLATMLHYSVELRAMRAIRQYYKSCRPSTMAAFSQRPWTIGLAVSFVSIAILAKLFTNLHTTELPGIHNLAQLQPVHGQVVACHNEADSKPIVLLALGQSNAGNHGEPGKSSEITVFADKQCYLTTDPLPGGTGSGSSIWNILATTIQQKGESQRVIIAPLAVGATSIMTWTEPGAVRDALDKLVSDLHDAALVPTAVLWQQGETDVYFGTESRDYRDHFLALAARLRAQHITAPIFIARNTYCHGDGYGYIARVQASLPKLIEGVVAGPDMDSLSPALRYDECHLTQQGLREAASRWDQVLLPLYQKHRPY